MINFVKFMGVRKGADKHFGAIFTFIKHVLNIVCKFKNSKIDVAD